jgi:hypothetical protein
MNTGSRLSGALAGALAALFLAGCGSQKPSAPAKTAEAPQAAQARPAKGGLRERIVRSKVPEQLHQLALFYRQYFDTMNRAPSNTDEFRTYIEHDDRKLADTIRDKYYTVVCKVRDLGSSTVIAYEREADPDGKRWVVLGDASAHKMDEAEFDKALGTK